MAIWMAWQLPMNYGGLRVLHFSKARDALGKILQLITKMQLYAITSKYLLATVIMVAAVCSLQ